MKLRAFGAKTTLARNPNQTRFAVASIYIMAIVFSVVALGVFLLLWRWMAPREIRGWILLLFLLELPMEPISFYLVRLPIDHIIVKAIGKGTARQLIGNLYA